MIVGKWEVKDKIKFFGSKKSINNKLDFQGKCGNEKIDSVGFELKTSDHMAVKKRFEE